MTGSGRRAWQGEGQTTSSGGNNFNLGDYVDVPSRVTEFYRRYPEGRLRPLDPAHPYTIETLALPGGEPQQYVVYAAAAYRSPDDELPGVGVAWEQFPGRTPYTRHSELQNAETSAWGRALGALGIGLEKGKMASREEVRNRQAERDMPEREREQFAPPISTNMTPQRIAEDALAAGSDEELQDVFRRTSELSRKVPVKGRNGEPVALGELIAELHHHFTEAS